MTPAERVERLRQALGRVIAERRPLPDAALWSNVVVLERVEVQEVGDGIVR